MLDYLNVPFCVFRYLIRPRILRDVSNVDLSTTILGNRISFPVGVSPSAFHCLAHPDGEKATARGVYTVVINCLVELGISFANKCSL